MEKNKNEDVSISSLSKIVVNCNYFEFESNTKTIVIKKQFCLKEIKIYVWKKIT